MFSSKFKCGCIRAAFDDGEGHGRGCGHGGRRRPGLRRGRGPRMFDSGAMRYLVLQRIAEQARHGYEIIKAIEEQSGGVYSPSPGMIYPMLSMLEDLGYLSVSREGAKKLYTITPEGKVYLDENRAFVEAIEARIASRRRDCSGVVRQGLQTLEDALFARVRRQSLSEEQLKQVTAILAKAAADIEAL